MDDAELLKDGGRQWWEMNFEINPDFGRSSLATDLETKPCLPWDRHKMKREVYGKKEFGVKSLRGITEK